MPGLYFMNLSGSLYALCLQGQLGTSSVKRSQLWFSSQVAHLQLWATRTVTALEQPDTCLTSWDQEPGRHTWWSESSGPRRLVSCWTDCRLAHSWRYLEKKLKLIDLHFFLSVQLYNIAPNQDHFTCFKFLFPQI